MFLIGAVAGPVAQELVDQSVLSFTEANITFVCWHYSLSSKSNVLTNPSDITNEGFSLSLKGSLTDTGPLDALITFTDPVTVTWEGQSIATIALPPICAAANTGVPDYETSATLSITDLDA